jgi:hypothetical protein
LVLLLVAIEFILSLKETWLQQTKEFGSVFGAMPKFGSFFWTDFAIVQKFKLKFC